MSTYYVFLSIIISAALWLKYLYKYDKIEPEPLGVVLRIGLLGGFLSTTIAGIINSLGASVVGVEIGAAEMPFNKAIMFSTLVGFNEEFCKAIITILLVRNLDEMNEPIDAVIYSTAVGLGFSAIENISYTAQYGLINLVFRSLSAMPLHIGLASIWGYQIARAKFITQTDYFTTVKDSVIIAAIFHAIYDCILFVTPQSLWSLAFSLLFGYLIIRFTRYRLLYLIKQSPFLRTGECANCRTLNSPKANVCVKCGSSLKQEFYTVCKYCFHRNPVYNLKCSNCDKPLNTELEG